MPRSAPDPTLVTPEVPRGGVLIGPGMADREETGVGDDSRACERPASSVGRPGFLARELPAEVPRTLAEVAT